MWQLSPFISETVLDNNNNNNNNNVYFVAPIQIANSIQRQRRRGLHTVHQVRLQQFRKSVLREANNYNED